MNGACFHRRRILRASLLAAFCIALAPSSAAAGTATIEPCANGVASNFHYWTTTAHPSNRWTLAAYCPMLAELKALPYQPGQLTSSTWLLFGSGLFPPAITQMRFSIAGSDGTETSMQQGIRACATNTCGPFVTPGGPDVVTPVSRVMTVDGGDIPAGANRIRIEGKCLVSGGCQAARPLRVSNLQIDIEDNVVPTVEPTTPEFAYSGPAPVKFDAWNPGLERTFHLILRDTGGVGIKYARVKLGDRSFHIESFGCGSYWTPTVAYRCSTAQRVAQVENLGGGVNYWSLEQGPNVVSFTAVDAAGNASETFTREFLLDSRPPGWRALRASTSLSNGWQSSPNVELEWDLTEESGESFTESGVRSIRYSIESVDDVHADVGLETRTLDSLEAIGGIQLPGRGRFQISAVLIDGAGNESESQTVMVGVDDLVLDAPTIEPMPMIGAAALLEGATVNWQPPENRFESNSGICGYAMRVDKSPSTDPGLTPNVIGEETSATLPPQLPNGTNYIHLRAFSCAGVPGGASHMAFEVDASGPQISISAPSPSGWYTDSHPLVLSAVDDAPGQLESRVTTDTSVGSWLAVESQTPNLPDGRHQVTFEVRDPLGNSATAHVFAEVDANEPTVVLGRRDPDHPTLVRASVSDAGSGVASGSLQIRPAGGHWRQLAGTFRPSDDGLSADVVARIPDMELPAGRYELRATALDHAGHAVETVPGGSDVESIVELPLRGPVSIAAGYRDVQVKRRCVKVRSKRVCRKVTVRSEAGKLDSRVVGYGKTDEIRGRMVNASGLPLGGRVLEVTEEILGKPRVKAGTVTTEADGTFRHVPKPGPSRRLVFRFAGDERDAPAEAAVRLLVRARVDLKARPKVVRSGGVLRFVGRVHAAGATMPRSGLRVDIDFRGESGWRPFTIRIFADADGRFAGSYRFKQAPSRPVRYRFTATVLWVDGFAYETGVSSPEVVVLR